MYKGPEARKLRRENAEVLKLERAGRTDEEQLKLIKEERPGKALKETAKLEEKIAKKKKA